MPRTDPSLWLAAGLGNPDGYENTRHNAGARAIEETAAALGTKLRRSRYMSLVAEVALAQQRIVLARPLTWMNESGQAVGSLVQAFGVVQERLIIVHDDIDLEAGTIRIKVGGGTGGHRGLDDVVRVLKKQDFVRVRIGVGRPSHPKAAASYVLDFLSRSELEQLNVAEEEAAQAIIAIARNGPESAMRTFHST